MKRLPITFACLCVLTQVMAQQSMITGHLLDSTSQEPLQFAHVQNVDQALGTLTDRLGRFRIPAQVKDTVVFSIVGYQTLAWIITEKHLSDTALTFKLPADTVLLKEVTISELPTEEEFKRRILATKVEDTSFWYHGVPEPVFTGDKTLEKKYINNPLVILAHPISSLGYHFSKKEKERRKMHEINKRAFKRNRVDMKFTRSWVGGVTSLKGDVLTDFISFCNYDVAYLDETPLYMIQEDLLVKLDEFQQIAKE
ncbi:MAG: carboxypeptidase-like regulatory domain-containing protein [Cytophagales bacterium]|nr:carboxypeptidase-like regulatory domain-containing protein [Cytophagales bacterium]